jgi:hypothetical protein
MNNLILNIANYRIKIKSLDYDLDPGKRFRNFIEPNYPAATRIGGLTVDIRVYYGTPDLPYGAECVFHAPFIEETDGHRTEKNPEFWSIWKNNDDLFIKTSFPLSKGNKKALLKFSFDSAEWHLYIDSGNEKCIDPLEYPLDGLVLYYLSVIKGDIMIHASGVNHKGKGYAFSGVSGKGKTTMSALWKKAGATIIHDDRLILRKTAEGFRMYNTPVYDDEEPVHSGIDSIFIIEHGRENTLSRLEGAYAASALLANCIQHNWSREIISGLLQSATGLCSEVPVYALSFKPDTSVIDQIVHELT